MDGHTGFFVDHFLYSFLIRPVGPDHGRKNAMRVRSREHELSRLVKFRLKAFDTEIKKSQNT